MLEFFTLLKEPEIAFLSKKYILLPTMNILKAKEFWIHLIFLSLTLMFCDWIFKSGWQYYKGDDLFLDSFKNYTFNGLWIAIAAGISYSRVRKSQN